MTGRDTYDMFSDPDRGRFGDNESDSKPTRVTGSSDLIDLELVLHAETHPGNSDKGAILISDNGDEARAKWIPKSLAQVERSGRSVPGTRKNGQKVQLQAVTVTVPNWVATEKGLM